MVPANSGPTTRPQEAAELVVPNILPRNAAGVRLLVSVFNTGIHKVAPDIAINAAVTITGMVGANAAISNPERTSAMDTRSSGNQPSNLINYPMKPPCSTAMMAPGMPKTIPTSLVD